MIRIDSWRSHFSRLERGYYIDTLTNYPRSLVALVGCSHKAAIRVMTRAAASISRLAWGRSVSKVTLVASGRPQFLPGRWPVSPFSSLLRGSPHRADPKSSLRFGFYENKETGGQRMASKKEAESFWNLTY